MMCPEIENRMVVDSEWPEEKEVQGYVSRYGTFVEKAYILEIAMEETTKCPMVRDTFVEMVLDYIESNEEAKEKFLKWFYPDYKEG